MHLLPNIPVWIALAVLPACAPSFVAPDSANRWSQTPASSLDAVNVARVKSPDGRDSITLVRMPGEKRYGYRVKIGAYAPLELLSRNDVSAPAVLSLESGPGAVIRIRPDGRAAVIDESAGHAVAESDPTFVSWENGAPVVIPVQARRNSSPQVEGVGSRQVFVRWKRDGRPELREEAE